MSSTLASEDESFADTLTQAIMATLAGAPRLRVVPPRSLQRFKGRPETAVAIGRELGVRTVLEGSIRNVEDRVRITAQLVSTADGNAMWSETFERKLLDGVAAIRTEVSLLIGTAVREKLSEK